LIVVAEVAERGRVVLKKICGFAATSVLEERLDFLSLCIRVSTLVAFPPNSVACTVDLGSLDRFILPLSIEDVFPHATF
jgi:hypothetical protein